MTFDDYEGKECLVFFADPSFWGELGSAMVQVVGAELGGIWIECEELTKKLGPEALKVMCETDQGATFFIPFSQMRMVFCSRLKLAEDRS